MNAAALLLFLIPGSGSSGEKLYAGPATGLARRLYGESYFGALQDKLKAAGVTATVCPATEDDDARSLNERAEECVQMIEHRLALSEAQADRKCAQPRVALYGHSMGGVIARIVAADARLAGCVNSVTTLSTPHRGTPIADWVAEKSALDFPSLIFRMADMTPKARRYLSDLTTQSKVTRTPDVPGILYFSFTNSIASPPFLTLKFTASVITDRLSTRPPADMALQPSYGSKNDGVVPEYSMAYGQVLGHLEGDHWSTGCLVTSPDAPACQAALSALVPHLAALVKR